MASQRIVAGVTTIENEFFTDDRGAGRIVRTYQAGRLISSVRQYFTEQQPAPAHSTIRLGRFITEQGKRRRQSASLLNGGGSSDDDELEIIVGPITPR